ncbi:MAG: 4Fe-4S dicluster domain-containing protein [Slackia sp.]|nr:4Fe-4S dicluster domain-containing protein [Slackia sp.]
MKKQAVIGRECVACGTCAKACPFAALSVPEGRIAVVEGNRCVGCGVCAKSCPAEVISIEKLAASPSVGGSAKRPKPVKRERRWYDYLYIITPIYLTLGCFNILFAWIGLVFFFLPLILSAAGKGKLYCNWYCDRGQFLDLLGSRFKMSRRLTLPRWIRSRAFRYAFLAFFMTMFFNMLFVTWLVFAGSQDLGTTVQLLWTFQLPWHWAYPVEVSPGVAQFAFGFYGVMLTSTVIGLFTMVLFRPRSWCVFCPMGTMTQLLSSVRPGGPSCAKSCDDSCSSEA